MTQNADSPLVSVVVPTCNGMGTLPPLVDAIRRAALHVPTEIVAVDSGSTDGTREWLVARADQIIDVPPAEFNHGAARNLGVQAARAPFVVLTVQDALPADNAWLHHLVEPLQRNALVAGTWARQEPRPDASVVTRYAMSRSALGARERLVHQLWGQAELDALAPFDRMARCRFDNVCSCVRKLVWQDHPFPVIPIAEDLAWAREVLLAGYQLIYVPEAVVIHSHDRSAAYEYQRTRALHRQLAGLFDVQTIPTLGALGRSVVATSRLHWRLARQARESRTRALALGIAWPVGQYLGAFDHRWHRPARSVPGV